MAFKGQKRLKKSSWEFFPWASSAAKKRKQKADNGIHVRHGLHVRTCLQSSLHVNWKLMDFLRKLFLLSKNISWYLRQSRIQIRFQNIFDPIVYVPGFSRVRAHTFGGPQRTRIVDVLTRLLHTNVIWGVHTYKEEIHGKDIFLTGKLWTFFLTERLWCWIFKNIISSQGGHWFFSHRKNHY